MTFKKLFLYIPILLALHGASLSEDPDFNGISTNELSLQRADDLSDAQLSDLEYEITKHSNQSILNV